jgi:hypothetical protein
MLDERERSAFERYFTLQRRATLARFSLENSPRAE